VQLYGSCRGFGGGAFQDAIWIEHEFLVESKWLSGRSRWESRALQNFKLLHYYVHWSFLLVWLMLCFCTVISFLDIIEELINPTNEDFDFPLLQCDEKRPPSWPTTRAHRPSLNYRACTWILPANRRFRHQNRREREPVHSRRKIYRQKPFLVFI